VSPYELLADAVMGRETQPVTGHGGTEPGQGPDRQMAPQHQLHPEAKRTPTAPQRPCRQPIEPVS